MNKLPESFDSIGFRCPNSEESTFQVIFRFTNSKEAMKWLENIISENFKDKQWN